MKKVWLCLWWGAAKWFSHIWVIKRIEELWLEVTEVAWTSMWALIWAVYAFWKTSGDMVKIVDELSFLKLIDIDFKRWLIAWNRVLKFLDSIFWDARIEDCSITLMITATNIKTWKTEIFTRWKIKDAVRASISIPWIFSPYKIWDNYYVDWGLKANLPAQYLTEDFLVLSSACFWNDDSFEVENKKKILWIDFNESFFKLNYRIIQRTTELMIVENERKSIDSLKKDFVLISPDYTWFNLSDFKRFENIVQIWYEEAKNLIK